MQRGCTSPGRRREFRPHFGWGSRPVCSGRFQAISVSRRVLLDNLQTGDFVRIVVPDGEDPGNSDGDGEQNPRAILGQGGRQGEESCCRSLYQIQGDGDGSDRRSRGVGAERDGVDREQASQRRQAGLWLWAREQCSQSFERG